MGRVLSVIKKKLTRFCRRRLPAVGTALLIVVLMAFTLYNCLDLSAVKAETTPAVKSYEYEIAGLYGYVFRDETVLYSSYSGASVYLVGDGERVSAGTEVVRTYASGSTEEYLERRSDIERKIELLERSARVGTLNAEGIDSTRELTSGVYEKIMSAIADGQLASAAEFGDDFFVGLNARAVLTGQNDGLSDELAAARSELDALVNSYSGTYESVSGEGSGYFWYGSDGYEEIFDYSSVDTLTPEALESMAASSAAASPAGKYAVGRMIGDYVWYLAVPADAELCRRLEGREECDITFDRSGRSFEMELYRTSYSADGNEGVLIFSSGYIPEDFDFSRVQSIELLVEEISGFRVPADAVQELRGVKGVYVLSSSTMIFRKINIIYEGDGYVVAAYRDLSAENYAEYLDLNDEIIISVSDGDIREGRTLG